MGVAPSGPWPRACLNEVQAPVLRVLRMQRGRAPTLVAANAAMARGVGCGS